MKQTAPVTEIQRPLASIGERFTAQFIDGLVGAGVGVVTYLAAKSLELPLELLFLTWLVYLLVCDGFPNGQSIGKRFTKSSVVHVATGDPCSYWRSCVRNLSLIVLGFIDVIFIVGSSRRRLGDYLAGTKVVRAYERV